MCNCPKSVDSDIIKKCINSKNRISNREHELNMAKAILQKSSDYSGDNVFDHLSDLIKRIIDEDPKNVADYFDEYSRIVREEKFHMTENSLMRAYHEPHKLKYAVNIMRALKLSLYPEIPVFEGEEEAEEQEKESTIATVYTPSTKDVMHLQFYWSLCGLGVEQDSYLLSHSIEKFEKHDAIQSCRFWGKIFGLKKNYYVLEVDLKPDEISNRIEQMKAEMMEKARLDKEENYIASKSQAPRPDLFPGRDWKHCSELELKKMHIKQPAMPKNYFEPAIDIPPEPVGRGLNRKTYFVCNNPLEEWIELPIVTPKQIVLSRVIKKFFTGDLDTHIVSYPPFPGKEKHYLRAMIARISSGTHISPIGFMKVGRDISTNAESEEEEEEEEEDEEEDEEETGSKKDNDKFLIENIKYKPLPVKKLLNAHGWQHTRPAILSQGRIVAYDEKKYRKQLGLIDGENLEEDEEEEEDESEEEGKESERLKLKPTLETGPTLFTSCSEDLTGLNIPSWSIRKSNHHNTKNMIIMVKSNIWPGAHAFAMENIVDNLYIGWGHKYETRNYSPPSIRDVQDEYPIGPEIMEILDPTAKDEEDWRVAHIKVVREHSGEEFEDEMDEEGNVEEEEDEED